MLYFPNKYVDTKIRPHFKIKNNKVYVRILQGDFWVREFTSVVEKEYDNNVIRATIVGTYPSGEQTTVPVILIKEDGKWKLEEGSLITG